MRSSYSSIATLRDILRVVLDIKHKLEDRGQYYDAFRTLKSIFGSIMQTAWIILNFSLSNAQICAWINNQMTR